MAHDTEGLPGESWQAEPPIRVMALHALYYCERLFYLEEVEEIRVADHAVYAGRSLHQEITGSDEEIMEVRSVEVCSERWGLIGKVDGVRRRDGVWVVYEHKRGRCCRGEDGQPEAWPSDRIQAVAYAVLLEEVVAEPVRQARIRYHADNVTVKLEVDEQARDELRQAILRARELRRSTQRPPVTENERLCPRCSLNVVCLPEEERLQRTGRGRLSIFPADRQRYSLHVVTPGAKVSRASGSLVVTQQQKRDRFPIEQVDCVLLHGHVQISTQALHLCASQDIPVIWLSSGGRFLAGTTVGPGRVHQRIRQYGALQAPETRLRLSRRLVRAKVETQLRYVLRCTRGDSVTRDRVIEQVECMRQCLRKIAAATSIDTLRGLEGMAAKAYFAALPHLLGDRVPVELKPVGRSKRPPRDRFNCLLSFGYALLQSVVFRSIVAVGLEPAFGFFHQPRTAAPPLVLDLMELFRTRLWEMPLVGSINRGHWDLDGDFQITRHHVWLSETGRKKAIALMEQRLQERHKHPYTGQSLSYARIVELEVRLLEKEWTGCPGLFARMRLR
ncbi:MAG: CRISPR-associated exonuclease Cas4/endonuclease Cas1 fusion [Pirellulaceae bacterium]|nr:MAG: CRISPR-associated exonuclease Cas4/endonuclease Cas1 fusion [Pirellulaceae bacterium]